MTTTPTGLRATAAAVTLGLCAATLALTSWHSTPRGSTCSVSPASIGTIPVECSTPGTRVSFVDSSGYTRGAMFVPPPGQGVAAESLTAGDSSGFDAMVVTDANGQVTYEFAAEPAGGMRLASGSVSSGSCTDTAHSFEKSGEDRVKWYTTQKWYYRGASTPDYLRTAAVISALGRGTTALTTERNNCGLPDHMNGKAAYQGGTARMVNMPTNEFACGKNDGVSVTAFGNGTSADLGLTCIWFRSHAGADEIFEADVRLNRDFQWYIPGQGCSGERYSVVAVTAHERGHAFGLGHVDESSHPHLTMTPRINPCDNSSATLGRGDIAGLNALYP